MIDVMELIDLVHAFKILSVKIFHQPDGTILVEERNPFDTLILEFYYASSIEDLINNEIFINRIKERLEQLTNEQADLQWRTLPVSLSVSFKEN